MDTAPTRPRIPLQNVFPLRPCFGHRDYKIDTVSPCEFSHLASRCTTELESRRVMEIYLPLARLLSFLSYAFESVYYSSCCHCAISDPQGPTRPSVACVSPIGRLPALLVLFSFPPVDLVFTPILYQRFGARSFPTECYFQRATILSRLFFVEDIQF